MRRRWAGTAAASSARRAPSKVRVPASGASKPAMRRRSVVLPEPDGPTTAVRALRHGEVDAVERRDRPVALADGGEGEEAHRPAIRRDWRCSTQVIGIENSTMRRA